jgi:glycosyltransferase involved in cell wall biosynthesis
VRLLRLSRNYGKEAAMTAGLDHASGDAVIILDADLQDPPELFPKMIEEWRAGVDIVLMKRRSRAGEPWLKRAAASTFYRLLNQLSVYKIPADTGDFRLLSRRAVHAIRRLPERNRYMKGLFAWVGMPTVTLLYDREARAAGTTKWNYLRLVQLGIEGITSFSARPLRLATGLGLLTAIFGTLFGIWIVFKAMVFGDPVQGYPSLMAMVTFLGGIQLITVGILGEYVGKTYIESKQRPIYLLRDITGDGVGPRATVSEYANQSTTHTDLRSASVMPP